MESLQPLELLLTHLVAITKFCLETISVLCVLTGLIKTLQLTLQLNRRYRGRDFPFNQVRLKFGTWLALALEFQLGADILATTVTPTWQDLAQLALVAVIRTFLNFFLSKEIEAELKLENARQASMSPNQPGWSESVEQA